MTLYLHIVQTSGRGLVSSPTQVPSRVGSIHRPQHEMERVGRERHAHKSEEELRSRKWKRRSSKHHRHEPSDSGVDSTSDRSHTPSRLKHKKASKSRSKHSKKSKHTDSSDSSQSPTPSKHRKKKKAKKEHKRASKHRKKLIRDKQGTSAVLQGAAAQSAAEESLRLNTEEGTSSNPKGRVREPSTNTQGASRYPEPQRSKQEELVDVKAILAAQTAK